MLFYYYTALYFAADTSVAKMLEQAASLTISRNFLTGPVWLAKLPLLVATS